MMTNTSEGSPDAIKYDEKMIQLYNEDSIKESCSSLKERSTNRMEEMKSLLDRLDQKLVEVVTQMNSVKRTRDELFDTTKKLQQNLEICGQSKSPTDDEYMQKLASVAYEIRQREEVVRALEKRELLLSHSMLSVISKWADEVERTLDPSSPQDAEITELFKSNVQTDSSLELPPNLPNPDNRTS